MLFPIQAQTPESSSTLILIYAQKLIHRFGSSKAHGRRRPRPRRYQQAMKITLEDKLKICFTFFVGYRCLKIESGTVELQQAGHQSWCLAILQPKDEHHV